MTDYSGSGYPPPGAGQAGGGQPPYGASPGQQGTPGYGNTGYGGQPYGNPGYGNTGYGGQPYGNPGYGSQPSWPGGPLDDNAAGSGGPGVGPYGPPPGNRSRKAWILGGVGAAVVVAVVVILVIAMGGNGASSGPKAAVEKLLKADVAGNVRAAMDVTCDPLKSRIAGGPGAPDKSYTIGKSAQNGNSATVDFSVVDSDNGTANVTAILQKQSGVWKVCDVETRSSGQPGGGQVGTGLPSDFPTGSTTLCVTPQGSTPICVHN